MPQALVFLHFLGGSARTWRLVANRLPGRQILAIDLPGYGDAAHLGPAGVGAMADHAQAAIAAAHPETYALIGHSMGAKVATVLARRAEDGLPGLAGLTHLVLVAGSPPAPEPMSEEQRADMLSWFTADPATSRRQAQDFINANTAQPLPSDLHGPATDDVLRADPAAWRHWLTHGSREDWRGRIGQIATPALIVTGAEDPELGRDGQLRHTEPHFENLRHVTLQAAKHLIPLEQPDRLAALIEEHVR